MAVCVGSRHWSCIVNVVPSASLVLVNCLLPAIAQPQGPSRHVLHCTLLTLLEFVFVGLNQPQGLLVTLGEPAELLFDAHQQNEEVPWPQTDRQLCQCLAVLPLQLSKLCSWSNNIIMPSSTTIREASPST